MHCSQTVMQGKILLALPLIQSLIISEVNANLFHLPWACAVLYDISPGPGKLIGACAIFTSNHVLVSVDNFKLQPNNSSQPYYLQLNKISVIAGSNYMNGSKSKFTQVKTVDDFFIGKTKHWNDKGEHYEWDEYISRPLTQEKMSQVQMTTLGVSFNVGIIKVTPTFEWTEYVRPITMNFLKTGVDGPISYFLKLLTSETPPRMKCITYSWNEKENKIRYHEVMFLNSKNCYQLFCDWDLTSCDVFPNETYHVCFKSTKYADVCPNARGAALYCPDFSTHSVLGILTTAPSCGQRRMPGVYSTLQLVISLYEKICPGDFSKLPRPDLEDPYALNQYHQDYEGVD